MGPPASDIYTPTKPCTYWESINLFWMTAPEAEVLYTTPTLQSPYQQTLLRDVILAPKGRFYWKCSEFFPTLGIWVQEESERERWLVTQHFGYLFNQVYKDSLDHDYIIVYVRSYMYLCIHTYVYTYTYTYPCICMNAWAVIPWRLGGIRSRTMQIKSMESSHALYSVESAYRIQQGMPTHHFILMDSA